MSDKYLKLNATPFECDNCGYHPTAEEVLKKDAYCPRCKDGTIQAYTIDSAMAIMDALNNAEKKVFGKNALRVDVLIRYWLTLRDERIREGATSCEATEYADHRVCCKIGERPYTRRFQAQSKFQILPNNDNIANEVGYVKGFTNYAGQRDIDEALKKELKDAGIKASTYGFMKDGNGEVDTCTYGELHGWGFERAWYYWIAKGPGIPPEYAERLHKEFGNDVRVDGHCGCPSPLEWFHGFAVDHYHVDTPRGLKALADTIKQVVKDAKEKIK